eukprot:155160_1
MMSWFNFLLEIYYLCYFIGRINSQSTTSSSCNFVAVDWDALKDNIETETIIRQYIENITIFYLPPFPKVWVLNGSQDIYNESFALIPYPIDESDTNLCFETYKKNDNAFKSYNFICDNGEPELRTYKDIGCDQLEKKFTFSDIDESNDWPYECNAESSCPYVSITETYYEDEECDENMKLNTPEYIGKYAVDVCLTYDSQTSYKYVCDSRTKTYTIITYSNDDCTVTNDIIIKKAGYNEDIDLAGLQCTSYGDVSNDINIFSVKSDIIMCTSIDEFSEMYGDYCVSSQVIIINDNNELKSSVPQFGPFGMQHVTQTKLSYINITNGCDLCNITLYGPCNITNIDETILIIDEIETQYIISDCSGGTMGFVQNIQSLQNISVYGIIFTSRNNISNVINSNNNINIPTRIIHPAYDEIFDNSINKRLSLSCNYRKGYPKEICVSVSCDDDDAVGCDNIMFAGTYIIQNMSDNSNVYNSNPTWTKTEMGDISKQYIWLNKVLINEVGKKLADIQPYIELQWIVSSQIGSFDYNSLYCNIKDVNDDTNEKIRARLSNFDVRNCEWKSFAHINNSNISINVATAPYKCFDNTISVKIAFTCIKTYKMTNIKDFIGTYYEIATGSNIYVKNQTENDKQLAVLKKGYKYSNCYAKDNILYTLPIENNNNEIEIQLPNDCENLNISWILYNHTIDDDDNK